MDRIEDCISFIVGKAAQQVSRRARDLLAPHGVTPVQYAVLKVIADAEGLTGTEIGGRMVLDSASITGVLDRLVTLGLVEKRADQEDRRVVRVVLTEQGRALQGTLDEAMDRLNAEASTLLGAERDRVVPLLRALGDRTNWK